ncbi:D-2-hydroxyacid dehydrogenase [Dyadobacter crusticola]|uniref:D-2-hydroxyacid dehydrogenase n=1 Tax=Dyadobacter crusticola TaxID=292407 RepID=UPI0004E117AF|nr:D-2-hydroxyacid dehydrogenase [Dyadobacter crusticola]
MKILLYADLQKPHQEALVEQLPKDAEVILKENLSDDQLKEAIGSADILIGNPPVELLESATDTLKFWQLENVGFEQYKDLDFQGKVANVGDMSAASCAETIVAGILGFYRGVHIMVKNQLKKHWESEAVESRLSLLGEKQVIILGSGTIAQHVKKILEAFECKIQMTAKSDPEADIHSFEELLAALPEADLIVNTLPGNLDNYVSEEFFGAIKEGALYANVGRGNTTDETALIEALESGKLLGAVLDVTEVEPLPEDSKLWELENVILTQHTGAAHKNRDRDKVRKFVENVKQFLDGGEVEDEVKLSDGY